MPVPRFYLQWKVSHSLFVFAMKNVISLGCCCTVPKDFTCFEALKIPNVI